MVSKAKQKGIYSCFRVTGDTTMDSVYNFLRNIGEERQILLNYPLPYWLVCVENRGLMRLSDKDFNKKYEVVE